MNLTEMQTAVSALAGDESKVQFTDAQIAQYLNWGCKEIARRLEILQKTVTFTALDSGVDTMGGVVLPTDFDQELHVFWGTERIHRSDYATYFNELGGGVGSQIPTQYTIQNYTVPGTRRMLFWPYQSPGRTGLNISVIYQGMPVALVAPTDITPLPDIIHEVICLYALARCKMQENDYQAYTMINGDVSRRLMELSTLVEEADGFSYPFIRSESSSVSSPDA